MYTKADVITKGDEDRVSESKNEGKKMKIFAFINQ